MANTRHVRANTGNRIALGVLIIVFSLFVFLCDCGAFGGVGDAVASFFVGFLGLADFAYSVMGVVVGVAVLFNLRTRMRPAKAVMLFGLLATGIWALHVYSSSAHIIGNDYGGYLVACYRAANTAGGMLFGVISFPLMRLITTVGALVVVCALFFVLAFFAFFPYIKKNVIYTASTKAERKAARPAKAQSAAGTKIDRPKEPALTDLSAAGSNPLYVVDVEGDPLQRGKRKAKGAEGYNPLYPNAAGGIEDEEVAPVRDPRDAGGYSPRKLARDILFNPSPSDESIERYRVLSNPEEALSNPAAPYSRIRRNEMRERLGVDDTELARRSFVARYVEDGRAVSPSDGGQAESPTVGVSDPDPQGPALGYSSFDELKAEQTRRFGERYADSSPEFESVGYEKGSLKPESVRTEPVRREVVKPTKAVPKPVVGAPAAAQPTSNMAGLHGAVARAISGEEPPAPPRANSLPEAQAYEAPSVQTYSSAGDASAPQRPIPPVMSRREVIPPTRVIRQQSAQSATERPEPAPTPAVDDARTAQPSRPSSAPPVQAPPTAAARFGTSPKITDSAAMERFERAVKAGHAPTEDQVFDASAPVVQQSLFAKQQAENIAKARRSAPPLAEFEHIEEERAKRRSAPSRDRRTEAIAKKLEKLDDKTERVTQVNIDQAISQATPRSPYVAPPIDILMPPDPPVSQNEDYESKKRVLIETLESFGILARVLDIRVGATFSLYTLHVEMPKGRTIGSLVSLENDIAMKMEEQSVRILAPIPGKNAVGIEVPNKNRQIVRLRGLLDSPKFNKSKSTVAFGLGKDLFGEEYVCDIMEQPHMLISGATGAGKSCCINSLIVSLLYKASPEEVRLILVDPKRVELSVYSGLPHLLLDEIIFDADKAIRALNWAIGEMQRRIKYLSDLRFRDIDEYNHNCAAAGFEKMPRIVIVVDELADLMAMGKKAVEDAINRLASLARAAGIHLILATQRPSVDVISGTIKNNLPSRVAFKVTSLFDSRTILDNAGAEKLLGFGDMFYKSPKAALPVRMQGAFISNAEVKDVVQFIKEHNECYYDDKVKDAIFKEKEEEKPPQKEGGSKSSGLPPELFDALRIGISLDGAPIAISSIQRKLGLGWPKAAKIYDMMDEMGYLKPDAKDPKRKYVSMTEAELEELIAENEASEDED